MKISFNELDQSIQIKDGLKSTVFLIKLLMILNLCNSILNLYGIQSTGLGWVQSIWIILGTVSVVVLYNLIVKKTTLEKIPIHQIRGLKQRIFMRRKKYFLELNNGKKRDLLEVKSDSEFNELKKMFSKSGISI